MSWSASHNNFSLKDIIMQLVNNIIIKISLYFDVDVLIVCSASSHTLLYFFIIALYFSLSLSLFIVLCSKVGK